MKKKFKTSQRPAKSLQWPLRLLLGFSLSATQWVVANKVADMVADMEVDMVADMEVDKVADKNGTKMIIIIFLCAFQNLL